MIVFLCVREVFDDRSLSYRLAPRLSTWIFSLVIFLFFFFFIRFALIVFLLSAALCRRRLSDKLSDLFDFSPCSLPPAPPDMILFLFLPPFFE